MLVDQDECWFSRFAQPQMHTFASADNNLRLVQREPEKNEAGQAIACFGAVCDQTKERYFSFAEGQPNSTKSIAFLSDLLLIAKARCKRVLLVTSARRVGTSQKWSGSGFANIIGKQNKLNKVFVCSLFGCHPKVPGSIRWNPFGCMPNVKLLQRMVIYL
jgi:hypothetical protein